MCCGLPLWPLRPVSRYAGKADEYDIDIDVFVGRTVSALGTTPTLDPRDISVGRAGIGLLGDADRLRQLAGEHARAMPI